jgi:hypothetical protein
LANGLAGLELDREGLEELSSRLGFPGDCAAAVLIEVTKAHSAFCSP